MKSKITSFRWGYILLFLMLAAIGVCFVAFRETLSTLALIIGILLAVYGAFSAVIAIADKKRGGKYVFKISIALMCIVCGIVTAIMRDGAIDVISSLIGLFLIIDGSFKLNTAAMSKRYKLVSWWLMVIPALLVIVGGFTSIKFGYQLASEGKEHFLSVIIGVTMVVDSIANLISAFYVGGFEKRMVREIRQEITEENEKKLLAEQSEEKNEAECVAEDAPANDEVAYTDSEAVPEADEAVCASAEAEAEPKAKAEAEPDEPTASADEQGASADEQGAGTDEQDASADETEVVAQVTDTDSDAPEQQANDDKKQKRAKKEKKRKGGR